MLLDLIAISILVISLAALVVIIGRKFPLLASVHTSATEQRLEERKSSLIEQRLRRKFTAWRERAVTVAGPVGAAAGRAWAGAHKKLVDLEHEYRVRSLPVFLNRRQRHKLDAEIQALLEQARAMYDEGEYAAAEEKALQAIRLEPRSVPAFDFLGELYMKSGEYGHAREVYRYLLKLVGESDAIYEHLGEADQAAGDLKNAQQEYEHAIALNANDAAYYLNLAKVDRMLEEWAMAFERIQEALRREPNSPKVLDEYIEISIGAGKKEFAQDALKKLQEVNPTNSKIPEWQERINEVVTKPIIAEDEQSIHTPL
ncbi:MAG: tetratricopeptide repeat protein [Candidatus Kerfeldbacteria bacterium]|nr:tetratricopeptide repeat protein [Candidatus Kerfeldbacteria bacterium]